MDSQKADLVSILFSLELVIQFNLETRFAFPDYVKAFDRVKRNKLFEILQSKNIPNLLLKSIIEIYSGNEIKERINSYQKNIQLIADSDKAALYRPHYSTFT